LNFQHAVGILKAGGLVAFPTETVYGLGADATCPFAVARIYAAKGRPSFNPLISHVATFQAALELGVFNAQAHVLAQAFWPGPMTLVVPAAENCATCELARAGLNTIAIRVSSHPIAKQLLHDFGKPIVAPSANISGHVSPTLASHVQNDLGDKVDLILDGGSTEFGLESSIFACFDKGVTMLRPGSITRQMAENVLGITIQDNKSPTLIAPTLIAPTLIAPTLIAPGQMASHYAPKTKMRLNVRQPEPNEAYLAFGVQPEYACLGVENLSLTANLVEAAANLYAMLRTLDQLGAKTISVSPIPNHGLGEAIQDRLMRAASPRI
jgi:L-threonylcarbamoyladenylate synthase